MEIGYCPKCNVPVLGEKCGRCGSRKLGKMRFHEMGDIRPISPAERRILLSKIPQREVRNYLRGRLILLARQPGLDYRRDVFVDGFKLGTLEYIKDERWHYRFLPTGKGAMLFYTITGEFEFQVDSGSRHLKGKRLNREIEGDYAIFSTDECVGVAIPGEKGAKVRDLYCRKVRLRRKSTLDDAVQANSARLADLERKAVSLIRKKRANYVAFSGGKDSEVALYLAHLAGVDRAIYANTGLEFPETERFVYNFADFLGIELIEVKPKKPFWEVVEERGIPTKDNRWCTSYLKLEQIKKFRGTLVDGSRRYESLARMRRSGEAKLGNLRVIYPILDWLALDVWMYLEMKKLPHNPLYDLGYERIGCYICPAMLNAEFHNMKRTHPNLYRRWYRFLRKQGFEPREIEDGVWRWKQPPPKIRELRGEKV